MFEFEIQYKTSGEIDFLYAHSASELAKRYPNIDPASYIVVARYYID